VGEVEGGTAKILLTPKGGGSSFSGMDTTSRQGITDLYSVGHTAVLAARCVLILAPHTDDGELGCGGTIAKLVEDGEQVHYAAFCTAEESLPSGYPADTLKKEVQAATRLLGVPQENLHLYGYRVRTFSYHRQEILDDLIRLRGELSPNVVFLPPTSDLHQDHRTMAEEGLRAFKLNSLLTYEQPWNNLTFHTECFVPLEERHVARKFEALQCYESQKHRTYLNREFIYGLAKVRGVQIQKDFAEAFEVVRWIY